MLNPSRHLKIAAMLGVLMVCIGTLGYKFIFGWPLIDSAYMTIITLATVGFTEVRALTPAGRIFTMGLIVGGVFTLGYAVRVMAEYVVEQNVFAEFGRRRMEKRIAQLKDHTVVCGHGRIGRQVVEALKAAGKSCVVVDRDVSIQQLGADALYVNGDVTDEDALKAAGIDRAGVLIAVVGSDADNLFITMTARGLNPKLRIISRATDAGVRNKMLRAGADNVVLPYEIGGRRIASMVLTPAICEFLDTVVYTAGDELHMEEVTVLEKSWLDGKTMLASDIRRRTGAIVLAVKKAGGAMLSNPPTDMTIGKGDRLLSLGNFEQLGRLSKIASSENDTE